MNIEELKVLSIILLLFGSAIFLIWIFAHSGDKESQSSMIQDTIHPERHDTPKTITENAIQEASSNTQQTSYISQPQQNQYSKFDSQSLGNVTTCMELECANKTRLQKFQEMSSVDKGLIMNPEEEKVFWTLIKYKKNFNVHPQVALNSFLKYNGSPNDYKSGYGLSVDFLLTKRTEPIAVVEYYGGGHLLGDEAKKARIQDNDASKKFVCEKVGLLFVILTDSDLKRLDEAIKEKLLDKLPLDIF